MKIGFLLGSFDPFHISHLSMVTKALNGGMDKVVIVPAKHNPWKKNQPLPLDIRIKFIKDAIKPFGDKCEVTDIENEIEGVSYSYLTCNLLRKKFADNEFFIICGSDIANVIDKWKNYDTEIKPYFKTFIIPRNDLISSTAIRKMVKNNEILYPYVTSYTEKIIKENHFYID